MISILELNNSNNNAIRIQKWYKTHTQIKDLKKVHRILSTGLTPNDLQDIINMCDAISKTCNGDGAGLTSGSLIDMLLGEFLESKIPQYSEFRNGECDMKINDTALSLKKIKGKSIIALDWSKNKNENKREHFSCNVIIINIKCGQWWKTNPKKINSPIQITYNDTIPSGIYIIDKLFCKKYITLSINNKTNTLIDAQYVYIMIKRSISLNLFIPLPDKNKNLKFNIMNAFSE